MSLSAEPAGGVGQHGVDLAGVRVEVRLGRGAVRILLHGLVVEVQGDVKTVNLHNLREDTK